MLKLVEANVDLNELCKEVPKLSALYQSLVRKGLITEQQTLTLTGKQLIEAFEAQDSSSKGKMKKLVTKVHDGFDLWWKAYPGTDTFVHQGHTFSGSRSMRVKKNECKIKLLSILEEGEYTIEELIAALNYEIEQKKEMSVKTKVNKLTFMQNSLTYLNQRSYEPFIELIKQGAVIEKAPIQIGSIDI
jgi:hypothetical protein